LLSDTIDANNNVYLTDGMLGKRGFQWDLKAKYWFYKNHIQNVEPDMFVAFKNHI